MTEPVSLIDEVRSEDIRRLLLSWFERNARELPWRQGRSAYSVWISEIMLQQTRSEQARPYFERFMERFPTINELARGTIDEVLLQWQGLGYYARARNLHGAAQLVVREHGGTFPSTMDEARRLPGVGPYTASAVLSIAYGVPHAAVDGNVVRVISRMFAIDLDPRSSAGGRTISDLAERLLDRDRPGDFNEAMMELGATVCLPAEPDCDQCPVSGFCRAFATRTTDRFPVTRPRERVPHFDVAVSVVIRAPDEVLIQRRPHEAMLGGLWEFPGGKRRDGEDLRDTCRREMYEELGIEVEPLNLVCTVRHAYSHFKITLHAFESRIRSGSPRSANGQPLAWVQLDHLDEFAFPVASLKIIEAIRQLQAESAGASAPSESIGRRSVEVTSHP